MGHVFCGTYFLFFYDTDYSTGAWVSWVFDIAWR